MEKEKNNITFRINSTNWKTIDISWKKMKVNPQWDVFEFKWGEFKWEQLFTWEWAKRETIKAWKQMLSKLELRELFFNLNSENIRPGFISDNTLNWFNNNVYYWSWMEKNKTHAYFIQMNWPTKLLPGDDIVGIRDKKCALSVIVK